eukprot:scaffold4324_cov57-Phaeocystis_antarctica.AAC.6
MSADSPPTAMAALSAASARSSADAAGSGVAAGSGAGAATDGTSLDLPPGAVGRPALFFFLDFFEGACPAVACSAASSASSSSIAASARAACAVCIECGATAAADCGGAACGRVGSAVVVRPWAIARRVGRSVLARPGHERAAEGDRGDRAEHHREHHPGPGERHQHGAQGYAEAE